MYDDFQLLKLISAIGNLDDNDERIKYYELNYGRLKDYSMIFVDDVYGIDKTAYLNKVIEFDYDYNSLFVSNKLLCLNRTVLDNKLKGYNTITKNKVCISFDLNIISQMKYCIDDGTSDAELNKIIKLCKSGLCEFDSFNFVLENYMKNKDSIGLDEHAIEDIRAFETVFPYKRFSYDRGMPINERMKMLSDIYKNPKFKESMQVIYESIYRIELIYLLAMIHIYFKYQKLSSEHKFEKFLAFCDDIIKAFHPCANNLAKLFYDNPNLRFFKRIQKNNKQIIETIENMAWDLFHLRFLEKLAEISHNDSDVIIIPIFISKDKGLNEIRKAYQVKCLFKNNVTRKCHCFYYMNSIASKYQMKYFNEEAVNRRANSEHTLGEIIDQLKSMVLQDINN